MEMGSGSGANGSSDSLDGLMFGKKIYFEDVGNGANGSISSSSSSSKAIAAPPPPPKKGKALAHGGGGGGGTQNHQQQQQQPPRCQVEGCLVDLTGAKAYYCRHKVCGIHSKSPKVVVAGIEQRFCQQCSRFHQLQEFDQGKRSCRRRLAGHNERRRKPPPGLSPLSPRYGRLSSSFYEDSSQYRSYLMDFSYPRTQPPVYRASDRAATCNQWPAAYPYVNPSNHYAAAIEIPPSEYFAGVADSSCAHSLLSTQQLWGPTTVPKKPASKYLFKRGPCWCADGPTTDGCGNHVRGASLGCRLVRRR